MTIKENQSGFNGTVRCTVTERDKKEPVKQLKGTTAHWCCLMNACPMSSTVIALERWVELVVESVLQVVGVRGQTKMAQGHVVRREEWVEGSEVVATGLVPGFAYQPSSTIVGSERVVLVVGWGDGKTCLSVD